MLNLLLLRRPTRNRRPANTRSGHCRFGRRRRRLFEAELRWGSTPQWRALNFRFCPPEHNDFRSKRSGVIAKERSDEAIRTEALALARTACPPLAIGCRILPRPPPFEDRGARSSPTLGGARARRPDLPRLTHAPERAVRKILAFALFDLAQAGNADHGGLIARIKPRLRGPAT